MNLFDKKFVYLEWDDILKGKKVFIADTYLELRSRVENDTNNFKCTVFKNNGDYPFLCSGICYAFVYYDPNYNYKRAYMEGKVIQCRHINSSTWSDCTVPPSWYDDYEYRVKPEEPVFRVYKCSDNTLHISNSCIIDFMLEGTEEKCKQYIKEHYCDRCANQSCDMVVGSQFCQGFKEVKKRRMTKRELAHWLAEGNGQAWSSYSGRDLTQYAYEHDRDNEPCDTAISIRTWDETEWSEPLIEE